MNDITALMATMKAAAENLDGDTWHSEGASVYGGPYDVGDTVCHDHIVDCENVNGESLVAEFIALANPANVLTLVEALEKAQHDAAVDWEAAASLNVENQELKQRIAELESRTVTVKLPADAEHDVMAPVAAYFSEKFGWDGGAIRWDGRKEYDVLSDRVKYAIKMVCRRTGIQVIEFKRIESGAAQ